MRTGPDPSIVLRVLVYGVIACGVLALPVQGKAVSRSVAVRIVTDEAEAVLLLLAKKQAGQAIAAEDWQRLFASEGYTRLKRRELAMGRSFEDKDFQTFVLSEQLAAQQQALAETLERWRRANVVRAAGLAQAYLPKTAKIHAKIYPVIKPRQNSFVFDLDTDPAIFLYLDPAVSQAKFENTLAHELHHIGYGTVCPTTTTKAQVARLPQNLQTVLTYTRAFGEGFAMLAAAGGPEIHPHAVSDAKARARWDKDVANFDSDLRKVEQFFLDVLADRVNSADIGSRVAPFYGEQGAWYTVGWRMGVVIEKVLGRRALITAMCEPRELLATYNRAVGRYNRHTLRPLAKWSRPLIEAIRATKTLMIRTQRASAGSPRQL